MPARLVLRTDGAARGNPGPAGAGVVLEDAEGNTLCELRRYLGIRTNNQAEYDALVLGLREILSRAGEHANPDVAACLDSELVVRQLEGRYRVRDPELRSLFDEAMALVRQFASFRVRHVPREENRAADRLANEAIDLATDVVDREARVDGAKSGVGTDGVAVRPGGPAAPGAQRANGLANPA